MKYVVMVLVTHERAIMLIRIAALAQITVKNQ